MIKKAALIFLIMLCLITAVSAEETDIYKEQFSASGMDELENKIPEDAKDFLSDFSIDIGDSNWVNSINSENAFLHIWSFIKSGAKTPLKAFGIILALIILSTVISTAFKDGVSETVTFATVLAVSAALLSPIYSVVTAAAEALRGCAAFMTAFIPVFAGIVAASGKALTSASMSGVLLLAANLVTFIANFAVLPLTCGHLSLSIAASVSPLLQNTNLANSVKKLSLWIMGFISTVFVGILSIQTAINGAADSLTLRTAKFIVGSSVPVAGGVLSEALATVTASLSLLRSSVGIWGVLICALTFLPIIIELLMWRLALWGLSFLGDTLSTPKISALLKSVDAVLSVLVGVVLLTAAMFIISLTVVIMGGKGV
ncbi:MAG: hypothetical protein J6A78_01130 [Clostridia bacterium]|nr:hypothetical protein [Clostridia bacterium]